MVPVYCIKNLFEIVTKKPKSQKVFEAFINLSRRCPYTAPSAVALSQ